MSSASLVLVILLLDGCGPRSPSGQAKLPSVARQVGYGVKVSFGDVGASEQLKVSGWSKAEEKFTWTEGTTAVLKIRVAPSRTPVTLKMTMAGLVKDPDLPFQSVEVVVNDRKIADWQVGAPAEYTALIPQDFTASAGELTITLKIPRATSPKALGQNADPRILGVCCFNLELSKAD
jgi:hypothetical protein